MDRELSEAFATGSGWLAQQPATFRAALLRRANLAKFKRREAAFHVEDGLGGVFGVVSGSFLMHLPLQGGSMRLAHIVGRAVWFGHGPALTRDRRKISVSAAEPSVALHVPLSALQELAADAHAALSLAALGEYGARIAYRVVADLLLPRASQRIAATLLRLSDDFGGKFEGADESLALTQGQLAEMANVSRDVVNAALLGFDRRGWIRRQYGRVAILDRKALTAEAGRES